MTKHDQFHEDGVVGRLKALTDSKRDIYRSLRCIVK